jgi:hypothetical protein
MQNEREKMAETRKMYVQLLRAFGLNPQTISSFLWYVGDYTSATVKLCESIPDGVCEESGGRPKLMSFDEYADREIQRTWIRAMQITAGSVAAITCGENKIGKYENLELMVLPESKKEQEIMKRCLAVTLMCGFTYGENNASKPERFRLVIKYWRGILDTRRMVLQLAGEPCYTEEIRQANEFIKILEFAMFPRPAKSKRKAKA